MTSPCSLLSGGTHSGLSLLLFVTYLFFTLPLCFSKVPNLATLSSCRSVLCGRYLCATQLYPKGWCRLTLLELHSIPGESVDKHLRCGLNPIHTLSIADKPHCEWASPPPPCLLFALFSLHPDYSGEVGQWMNELDWCVGVTNKHQETQRTTLCFSCNWIIPSASALLSLIRCVQFITAPLWASRLRPDVMSTPIVQWGKGRRSRWQEKWSKRK